MEFLVDDFPDLKWNYWNKESTLPQSAEIGIPLATTRPFSNMMCLSASICAIIIVTKKTSAVSIFSPQGSSFFFFQVDHFYVFYTLEFNCSLLCSCGSLRLPAYVVP